MNPTNTAANQSILNMATNGVATGPGISYTPIAPKLPPAIVAKPSPTVVTSNAARTEASMNAQYLANNTSYEEVKRIEADMRSRLASSEAAKNKTPLYSVASALSDVNLNTKGETVKRGEGQSMADTARMQREADMAAVSQELSRVQQSMDARTAVSIENIKQEYAQLTAEQEVANKTYEAGTTTAGLVSGRSQYAPEIQQGIIKGAVDQGIAKLSEIQAKKAQLINEAEAARDERNYKLLTAKMDALRSNAKEEREYAFKFEQNVREAAKEQREAQKENVANESQVGDILAATAIGQLTGNAAQDDMLISQFAQAEGINPLVLAASINKYKAQEAKDLKSSLGPKVLEWQFYRSQGGNKTFDQYANPPAATGGGDSLSAADIKLYGLSPKMVGASKSGFKASVNSQIAPQWFIDQTKIYKAGSTQTQVQSLWNEFKVKQNTPVSDDDASSWSNPPR